MNAALQNLISRQLNPNEILVYQGQPDAAREFARGWWITPIGFLMAGGALLPLLFIAAMQGLVRPLFLSSWWFAFQGWLLEVTGDLNFVNWLQQVLTQNPWGAFGSVPGPGLVLIPFVFVLVLFLAFGVWLMLSPQRFAKTAKNTLYMVTNKRAIIIEPSWRAFQISSYNKNQLEHIERVERLDGSGSLYFASNWVESAQNNTSHATVHHGASTQQMTVQHAVPTFRRIRIGFENIPDVQAAERALHAIS
jgi:hypothetical protein